MRSGRYTDAVKALLTAPVSMPLEDGKSVGLPQLSTIFTDGQADTAASLLEPLAAANKDNIWLRIILAQAARGLAEAGAYAQADRAAALLVDHFAETRDAGDTLWWLGRYYRDKGMTPQAVATFRMLVDKCADHFAADDAQMTIARLFEVKDQTDSAIQELLRLGERFPDSRLAAYSYYHAAHLAQGQGNAVDARKYLTRAAETGIMDFYAHRALDKLLPADKPLVPGGRNLRIDGRNPVLQTVPGLVGTPAALPENWEASPQMARLQFFGLHGLDAGEWEALDILKKLGNSSEHEALYQAVAEAGFAHTALEFAQEHNWGVNEDGEKTTARLRLELPRAYWPAVLKLAKETGVDPYLILAVAKQESTYRATVISHAGATGVMQLMPTTADWMVEVEPAISSAHADNLKSPENSIRLGAYYLMRMQARSDQNLVYAVASYNGGPGNVDKWRRQMVGYDLDNFVENIPFDETRMYVKKVLGYYAAYHSLYPEVG
jgi:soluble lytic murein transglycosylase